MHTGWASGALRYLLQDGNHCWAVIIGSVLLGGIVATAWSWRVRSREEREPPRWGSWLGIDVALTLAVAGLSAFHHLWLHDAINPGWFPYAQDFRDYLSHTMAVLDPTFPQPCHFRYPMFGWISAQVCQIGHFPPYLGTMWASLVSSILLPVALFLLGRQIAPRPVAVAGAFLFCHFDAVAQNMGTPTDYPFCTLAYIGVIAAGMWALRRGGSGRFLVFGVACAIMLGATAKGLTVVLPALAFGLVGLAWHGRTHLKGIPPALAALILPLVAIWAIYHHAEVEAFSLEFQVFNVMDEDALGLTGHHIQPDPRLDWNMHSPWDQRGHWVVGQTEALRHFPSVIRFFVHPTEGRIDFAFRARRLLDAFSHVFNLRPPWFLLLAVPGCLAGLMRPAKEAWVPSMLAAGLCLVETLGQLLGGVSVDPQFRYIQPLVTTLPLFVLVGASALPRLFAPRRSGYHEIAFWPVLPLLALILFNGASPYAAARLVERTTLTKAQPLFDLWSLQGDLWPEDGIVDLTVSQIPDFVFFGTTTPVLVGYWSAGQVPASTWRRRLLVEEACGDMDHYIARRPERFHRIRPCVVEDLHPNLAIYANSTAEGDAL